MDNEINKRKLKVIEAYIIKYQARMYPENMLKHIIWLINCNLGQLEYWEKDCGCYDNENN